MKPSSFVKRRRTSIASRREALPAVTDRSKKRRVTAAGLLAAFMLPGTAVLLLAAHELLEHDHDHHGEEAWAGNPWHSPIVRTVLEHGHSHEADTPTHDHEAVRRADCGFSIAPELLISPIVRSPLPGVATPHRSICPAAHPEAAARGAPETLSLLCVLLI